MGRQAAVIDLASQERVSLESWVRAASGEHRYVLRGRIVLLAADGQSSKAISKRLGVRRATVSRWRTRFAASRLDGLRDRARSASCPADLEDLSFSVLRRGLFSHLKTLLASQVGGVPCCQ